MSIHRGSGFFTSLLALLFVGFVALAIAGYSMGWLTVQRTPQQTTIQIDTQEVEEAASDAQREGEELLQKAGETLRKSGEAIEERAAPAPSERPADAN